MKKVISLIICFVISISVYGQTSEGFSPIEDDFEFTYKFGYIVSSEDMIDGSSIFGISAFYNNTKKFQVGMSVYGFNNNDHDKQNELTITDNITSEETEEESQLSAVFSQNLKYKIDAIPVLLNLNYKFRTDNLKLSAGVGFGYSYNHLDIKSSYQAVGDIIDEDFNSSVARKRDVSENIDDCFVFALNATMFYQISDDWDIGIQASYFQGSTEVDSSQNLDETDQIFSENFDVDLDYFSIFLAFKYRVFA